MQWDSSISTTWSGPRLCCLQRRSASPPLAFREQVFYLAINRPEIVLRPGCYGLVELCGKAQGDLLFAVCHTYIDARKMIVDGAVGMVEMALERLSEKDVVQLDEERKAATQD